MSQTSTIDISFKINIENELNRAKKKIKGFSDYAEKNGLKGFNEEIDKMQSSIDELYRAFQNGMKEGNFDTGMSKAFKKEIESRFQDIEKRTDTLEEVVENLQTTMDGFDTSIIESKLNSLKDTLNLVTTGVSNTQEAIDKITAQANAKGVDVKLVDTNKTGELKDQLRILEGFEKSVAEAKKRMKSMEGEQVSTDFVKNIKIIEKVRPIIKKGISFQNLSEDEVQNLQKMIEAYRFALNSIWKYEKEAKRALKETKPELNGEKLSDTESSLNVIEHEINRQIQTIQAGIAKAKEKVNGELKEIGKVDSTQINSEMKAITIPIKISSTRKGLTTEARNIIDGVNSDMQNTSIEVGFTLVSSFTSRRRRELLQQISSQLENLTDDQQKEKLSMLIKDVEKQFSNDVKITIKNNIKDEEESIKEGLKRIREAAEDAKITIRPKVEISEEQAASLEKQWKDLVDKHPLNITQSEAKDIFGFGLGKGKNSEPLQLDKIKTALTNVITKIKEKTQSFEDERNTVKGVVYDEVEYLKVLQEVLMDLRGDVDGVSDKFIEMFKQLKEDPTKQSANDIEAYLKLIQTVLEPLLEMVEKLNSEEGIKVRIDESSIETIGEVLKPLNNIQEQFAGKELKLNFDETSFSSVIRNLKEIHELLTNIMTFQQQDNMLLTDQNGSPVTYYRGLDSSNGVSPVESRRHNGVTFWVTDPKIAKTYAGDTGRIASGNMAITKPLIINGKGRQWNQLEYLGDAILPENENAKKIQDASKSIKDTLRIAAEKIYDNIEEQDELVNQYYEEILSTGSIDKVKKEIKEKSGLDQKTRTKITKNLKKHLSEYQEIAAKSIYGYGSTDDFYEKVLKFASKEYNGILFNDIKDSNGIHDVKEPYNEAVAFQSGQIKVKDMKKSMNYMTEKEFDQRIQRYWDDLIRTYLDPTNSIAKANILEEQSGLPIIKKFEEELNRSALKMAEIIKKVPMAGTILPYENLLASAKEESSPMMLEYNEIVNKMKQSFNSQFGFFDSNNSQKTTDSIISVQDALQRLVDLMNKLKQDPVTFFDKLKNGAIEVNEETLQALKSLNIYKNGAYDFSPITTGTMNEGGFIGDTYTLIARTSDYEAKIDDLIPKLRSAAKEGANVGQIINKTLSDDKELIYELQTTMSGTELNHESAKSIKATDEQILKLISDLEILHKSGLYVDFAKGNVLYDQNKGYSFIDLGTRKGERNSNNPDDILSYLGITQERVNKAKENNNALSSLSGESINKASSNLDQVYKKLSSILTALNHVKKMFSAAFDVIPANELSSTFNNLKNGAKQTAEETKNWNFSLNKTKDMFSKLVLDYQKYQKSGGKKSFGELFDDKKLASKMQARYDKEVDSAKQAVESINKENDSFKETEFVANLAAAAKEKFVKANQNVDYSAKESSNNVEKENQALKETAEIGQSITNIDEFSEALQKLLSNVSDVDKIVSLLKELKSTLNIFGNDKSADKIEKFANNLEKMAESINKIQITDLSSLKTLLNILDKADALKSFENILKSTQKQINNAAEAVSMPTEMRQDLLKNKEKEISSNLNSWLENQGLYGVNRSMKPTKDGLIEIKTLVKDIQGEWKEYTLLTDNGNSFSIKNIDANTTKIGKQVELYQKMYDAWCKAQNASASPEDQEEIFGLLSRDEQMWQQIVEYARKYEIELGKIVGVTRQTRQAYNGTLLESFRIKGSTGASITLDREGIDVAGRQEAMTQSTIEEIVNNARRKLENISTNRKGIDYLDEYYESLNKIKSVIDSIEYFKGDKDGFKILNPDDEKQVIELQKNLEVLFDTFKRQINNGDFISGKDLSAKLYEKAKSTMNTKSAMPKDLMRQYSDLASRLKAAFDMNKPVNEVKELERELNVLNGKLAETGTVGRKMSDKIWISLKSKIASQIAMYTSLYDFIRYGRKAFETISELDTALVDLRKTTTMSGEELNQFYESANESAKKYGATTQEVISQAAAWSRLGYSDKDSATKMAELSEQFALISPGMELDQATDGLVSSMKAFDVSVDNVKKDIMDKINIIGNTAATSNQEIVDMLTRSSAAMAEANNSLEDTIALESAAVEITRNPETTGTAFKTIAMRLRGYDEETEQLSDELKNIKGDIADLTKTASTPNGISIYSNESTEEMKSTKELLGDISKIYDQLSDKQQADLLEKIGGEYMFAA